MVQTVPAPHATSSAPVSTALMATRRFVTDKKSCSMAADS
jgi:hypothetical protein